MLQADADLAWISEDATSCPGIASIKGRTDAGGAISSLGWTTASIGTRNRDGAAVRSPSDRVPRQSRSSRYSQCRISWTSLVGRGTSSSAQRSTRT